MDSASTTRCDKEPEQAYGQEHPQANEVEQQRQLIFEAIAVLHHSKRAFQSQELGRLRQKLDAFMKNSQ